MAWISVHEQLKDHPKTRNLSRLLQCSRHEAVGILVCLWLWGIGNADREGVIISASEQDIADGIMYRGLSAGQNEGQASRRLVDCLMKSGWLDFDSNNYCYILHDWDQWQEQWYKAHDRRAAEAERKRAQRKNAGQTTGLSHGQSTGQSAGTAQHNRNRDRNRNQTVILQEEDDKSNDLCPEGSAAKDIVEEIVFFLNLTVGSNYKPTTDKTRKLISARLKEGFSIDNFKTVILKKCREWVGNPDMSKYLRPETLFGTKFESYLNQPEANPKNQNPYFAMMEGAEQ